MANFYNNDPNSRIDFLKQITGNINNNASGQPDVPVDIIEHKTHYQVLVNLPGIQPENIDISYQNGILQISGELPRGYSAESVTILLKERSEGQFIRRIQLKLPVEADSINAEFQSGVLNLILPKTKEALPRQITVQSVDKPQVIESHTVEKSKNAK